MKNLNILKLARQNIVNLNIALGIGIFSIQFLSQILVIPETRFRYFNFKFPKALTLSFNFEIDIGFRKPAADVAQIVRKIAHQNSVLAVAHFEFFTRATRAYGVTRSL